MRASTSVLGIAACLLIPALAIGGPAQVAIHPGDLLTNGCRLNFVFDSLRQTGPLAGKVWIGTAASCVGLGEIVSTPSVPAFGRVVYRGDPGIEENGIPGLQSDFALIEPREDLVDDLDPAIPGTDLPRYAPIGPDFTQSGEGLVVAPILQAPAVGVDVPPRSGILIDDDIREVRAIAPLLPDEAGGPIVHEPSGRALGIQTLVEVACCVGGLEHPAWTGPTVLWLQYEMGTLGYLMETRSAS